MKVYQDADGKIVLDNELPIVNNEKTIIKDACLWQEDDEGNWDTECGELFTFFVDGPEENKFEFCPYCGRFIKSEQYES